MALPFLANQQLWAWVAIAFAAGWLLWLLSPILAPFLAGAILAYILNPLVGRITGKYLGRTAAVIAVLLLVLALLVGLAFVVVPLLAKELRLATERLPMFFLWMNQKLAPWLQHWLGIPIQFDVETMRQMVAEALQSNQSLVTRALGSLKIGGLALLGFAVNALLVPVVLFYLLRDWQLILERLDALVPRRLHAKARAILAEIDAVLAEFLRGQLLVMVVMSLYYFGALWLARLEFALPIGIITGLLVFIPYVGAVTGFVLGTMAATMQFGSVAGLAWVWLAFAIGQVLEGMVVTPLLVGERIGLHPVAVIFALLAFGQLFGFFGVLLALPASAALLVALRHLRAAYLAGPLYAGPK